MKKLKLMLTTLSIVFALSGVFAPVVRADGDPQGGTDAQRRSTSSAQAAAAAAFWAALGRIMWF